MSDGSHLEGPRRRGPFGLPWPAVAATLGGLGVAAVVVALGSSGDAQGGGAPPSQPPTAPRTVQPSADLPPSMRPNPASPEPAVGLRRQRFARVTSDAKSRRLQIQTTFSGGPPCTVLGRVDVEETDSAVTVTLWVGRRRGARCDGPRSAVGYPVVVSVRLRTPLGERPVRDGAR